LFVCHTTACHSVGTSAVKEDEVIAGARDGSGARAGNGAVAIVIVGDGAVAAAKEQ
jgi:hypothetical protein